MVKALLRNALNSAYTLRRTYDLIRLRVEMRRHAAPPLLVYSMARVGSSTVIRSIIGSWPGRTYRLHTLDRERLAESEAAARRNFADRRGIPRYIVNGLYFRALLDRDRDPRPLPVVSLVRDPVARNLSMFFHSLDRFGSRPELGERVRGGVTPSLIDDIARTFVEDFDHLRALTWFDTEIRPAFGIDVYSRAFPHAAGFDICEGERARLLILRLEDLDRCAPQAFAAFLDLPLRLHRSNEGQGKFYNEAYRLTRRNLRLPQALLDSIYESSMVRHFYTADEIALFRERWQS
jgi:hypothetical protein